MLAKSDVRCRSSGLDYGEDLGNMTSQARLAHVLRKKKNFTSLHDKNGHVVVWEALLVQQLNHRVDRPCQQQLGPQQIADTAANGNTFTCQILCSLGLKFLFNSDGSQRVLARP